MTIISFGALGGGIEDVDAGDAERDGKRVERRVSVRLSGSSEAKM